MDLAHILIASLVILFGADRHAVAVPAHVDIGCHELSRLDGGDFLVVGSIVIAGIELSQVSYGVSKYHTSLLVAIQPVKTLVENCPFVVVRPPKREHWLHEVAGRHRLYAPP